MVAVRIDERLSARVDPSDVVQEALAAAYERIAQYLRDQPVPFYTWLRQIAWDRLLDLHRRHISAGNRSVRREELSGLSDMSALQLASRLLKKDTGPLQRLLRQELLARVRTALDRLHDDDREILILRHLEELSGVECAAILGLSETAAKQRHLRAVRRLRRLLDDETAPEP
jgi:RNA polymerase sigma-70 factor (ECF subfamily)